MIGELSRRVRKLKRDRATRRFIAHNRRVFSRKRVHADPAPLVLMELTTMHSAHIAYSYFAEVLASEYGATVRAYVPRIPGIGRRRLLGRLARFLHVDAFGVFASFGAAVEDESVLSLPQIRRANRLFEQTYPALRSKDDVVDLRIDGVWIGDLIYDSFLMDYRKGTLDLRSRDFQDALKGSLRMFVYWDDYIRSHDVRAINVSHCVYNVAIPLRIAVARGIPAYQVNATHGYRLSAENLFAYTDFHYFRERFATLPEEVKAAGLKEAERRIARRFSGEVGVDMRYSTKSAYGGFKEDRLLRESSRKKILVATHCFFDSPHSYGRNLFPDFYEWLEFLGRVSLETDYDWYIKTHPDYLPGTKEIIDAFVAKYSRFTLLPADSSHHQIIAEGIDVALTVWGTIGFEYALLGIPVINASVNNPHIAYEFNFHPRTIAEYRELLHRLDTLHVQVDKKQVYEYYFMRHIYNSEDWLFDDYERMIREIGGYDAQFTPKAYENWLSQWSETKHARTVAALRRFLASGDFRFDFRHTDRPFKLTTV